MKKSLSFLCMSLFVMGMSLFILNCSPNKMNGGKGLTEVEESGSGDLNCDDEGVCTKIVTECDSDNENCEEVTLQCDADGENCEKPDESGEGEGSGENEGNEEESNNGIEETTELNLGSCKFLDKEQASAMLVSPNKDSSVKFIKSATEDPEKTRETRAFDGLDYLAKYNKKMDVAQYTVDSEGNPKCTVLSTEACSFEFKIYTSATGKDCNEFQEDNVTCKGKNRSAQALSATFEDVTTGNVPRMFVATIDKGEAEDGSQCSLSIKYLGSEARVGAGCFDPDTKIRSVNNKEIPIKLLTKADKVFNPLTQKFMEIKKIVKGPEALPLVEVTVKGKTIKVSSKHAMITKSGVKIAMDLSLNDEIALEDGKSFNKIESIKLLPVDKNQKVINIELKADSKKPEDHAVLANGMVSGDLFLQVQKEKELKSLEKKADKKSDKKEVIKEEKVEQPKK